MIVEAYLRARVPGYHLDIEVLEDAAMSPIFAKPEALRPISIYDEILDHADEEDWVKALKYATSTLYYSASVIVSGGSRSEQVGDVRASQNGVVIPKEKSECYWNMGDELRRELGCKLGKRAREPDGMIDATELRTASSPKRWN